MIFFVFVRLLGLRGRAGEREGRREGGGWIFPRETNSLTFLTDLVPFPVDFPQEHVPYLKENVRYRGFPRKNNSFPYILDGLRAISHVFLTKTYVYLGCSCCCEKTDVTLVVVVLVVVVVVAVVVVVVLIILLLAAVVSLIIFYGYVFLYHYCSMYLFLLVLFCISTIICYYRCCCCCYCYRCGCCCCSRYS